MSKTKILIVEDEIILALDLEMRLKFRDFGEIKIVSSGEEAIEFTKTFKPDVILMDIVLKGNLNGVEAAKQIHTFSRAPIVYLTGNTNLINDPQLIATKPVAVLGKPCPEWQLIQTIEKALTK